LEVFCPEATIAVSRGWAAEVVRLVANHQSVADQTEGTERTKATQAGAALFPLLPLSPGQQTAAVMMGAVLSGAAPDICLRTIARLQVSSRDQGLKAQL
jgi:hypothetical protein